MNANLYAVFRQRFPSDLDDCWLETSDSLYYSWRDLERGSAKIANLLASLNLPAGARVAAQVEKSAEALMLYLATIRAGFVYLPLNTAYRASEMAHFIENASPSVIVCAPKNFGWIAQTAFARGTSHIFTLDEPREGRNSGSLLSRAIHFSDSFDTVRRHSD
ncbi:MAG: AMP-binding protein, partial [Burkholderiaceae bacterium]